MKVLVTGAGGFVGSRLVIKLIGSGHQVIAILRPDNGPEIPEWPRAVEPLPIDLSCPDFSSLPPDVDAVVTLGQSSHFREFPQYSNDVFSVNIVANFHLFEWARRIGVKKFIHVSSGGVYGGGHGRVLQESDTLPVGTSLGFYLGSKLCSEILFQNYLQYFEMAAVFRPFFIYGPFQRKDMLIRRIIESVRTSTPIQLQGEEGLKINPIYVDDVVAGIEKTLELTGSHTLNMAGPDILTLRQIADAIGRLLLRNPVFESKVGVPSDLVGSTVRASTTLKLMPTRFQAGIEKTIRLEGLDDLDRDRPCAE